MKRPWLSLFMTVFACMFYSPAAGKDSRQLLIDILCDAAIGSTSCEQVRKICAGINIGTDHSNFGVAELGGMSPKNFERDMHRWASRQAWMELLPELYSYPLRLLDSAGLAEVELPHFFILPHELFHTLHNAGTDIFEHVFGSTQDLVSWWDGASASPNDWFREHPVIPCAPPALRVPLGMHGDDGGMHGQEPVLVLSWNSVAAKPRDWSRLLFTMVKVSSVGKDTMHTVYDILRWSFQALADGTFPAADHAGRPFSKSYQANRFHLAGKALAAGIRGVWSEMRGDWKYLKEALMLKHHYGTRPRICHLCEASKAEGDCVYTDFTATAGHRCTLTTSSAWHAAYLAAAIVCPLLLIPGFNIFRVFFDIMHTLDLGVYHVLLPSCLWELTSKNILWNSTTRGKRFSEAYAEYRGWCKTNKVKSITKKRFSFKRFRPTAGTYPTMSQVTAKAAATRSLAYFLKAKCFEAAAKSGTRRDKLRSAMLHHIIQADIVCRKQKSRYFTADEQQSFAEHIHSSLTCYNALAAEAVASKTLNWKLIPKFHALTHIARDFGNINPRRVHCYGDEDMVGKMKRIFIKCHAATACLRSLQRYVIIVALKWWVVLHTLRGVPTQV